MSSLEVGLLISCIGFAIMAIGLFGFKWVRNMLIIIFGFGGMVLASAVITPGFVLGLIARLFISGFKRGWKYSGLVENLSNRQQDPVDGDQQ